MVVSDVRDDHRGAWRSLSGDVAKPIARHGGACRGAKTQKIVFSLIIISLHHRTLQNFAFRRGAKFRFRKFAYENSEQ